LSTEGLEFGSFYGKQRYKWSEIRATGVIRPVTGQRVFIELVGGSRAAEDEQIPLCYLPDNYGMSAEELANMLL
jgi:hypothetical protein